MLFFQKPYQVTYRLGANRGTQYANLLVSRQSSGRRARSKLRQLQAALHRYSPTRNLAGNITRVECAVLVPLPLLQKSDCTELANYVMLVNSYLLSLVVPSQTCIFDYVKVDHYPTVMGSSAWERSLTQISFHLVLLETALAMNRAQARHMTSKVMQAILQFVYNAFQGLLRGIHNNHRDTATALKYGRMGCCVRIGSAYLPKPLAETLQQNWLRFVKTGAFPTEQVGSRVLPPDWSLLSSCSEDPTFGDESVVGSAAAASGSGSNPVSCFSFIFRTFRNILCFLFHLLSCPRAVCRSESHR